MDVADTLGRRAVILLDTAGRRDPTTEAPVASAPRGREAEGTARSAPPRPTGRRVVLVTACRDEESTMRRTLDSVAAQTLPPALWVVVNDGSKDSTPRILAEYARRLPYLRVVRRPDRGRRAVGPGVIEAFYAGLAEVDLDEFDYLCKLDMDLDLPPRYLETLVERMEADPRLGTCSGKPYYPHPRTGELVSEGCGDETSVGMTKFYRIECFRQIGGFVRQVMWDGIDNHRCRMLGWKARSWDEPGLRFTHLRPMGSSDRGILTGRRRHGFGQYFMGTSSPYILASALFRLPKRPYLIGSAAMLAGYFGALLRREPRYGTPEFRRFLRRYQWDCLLRGKDAATRRLDETWSQRARLTRARAPERIGGPAAGRSAAGADRDPEPGEPGRSIRAGRA